MSFTSLHFYVFLIALVLLLSQVRRNSAKKTILLLASYWFYMSWDWRFGGLLLLMTVVNFYCGRQIYCSNRPRFWLAMSLIFSLGVLGLFKYCNFFLSNLDTVATALGLASHINLLHIILPVGISFYTFQALSYTIDIYRKQLQPVSSVTDFALFVSFFPQLVAGPIVRASYFLPQLSQYQQADAQAQQEGVMLIVRGLIKKVMLADVLARHLVDPAFASYHTHSSAFLLLALVGYSFQVYLDFSAYTDIARGCARLLGYQLPLNFNRPYLADSISNFWQRWHISMSSFFRDYLYYGLGGSKHGNVYLNLLLTFVAIGLWHGAGWNFLLYGFCHGALVGLERFLRGRGWLAPQQGWRWMLAVLRTFALVCLLRVMFRADDLTHTLGYLQAIADNGSVPFQMTVTGAVVLLLSVLLHIVPAERISRWQQRYLTMPQLVQAGGFVVLLYGMIVLGAGEAPVIYFQF